MSPQIAIPTERARNIALAFTLGFWILMLGASMGFSFYLLDLKETPSFWLVPKGQTPSMWQDFVFIAFYPLFALNGFFTFGLTLFSFRLFPRIRVVSFIWLMIICSTYWMLLAVIAITVLSNNIVNLIRGNPLHYH